MLNLTDNETVHESSETLIHRNIFDGVTRCNRSFLFFDREFRILPDTLASFEKDWMLVEPTTLPVTCLGCIGGPP